MDNDRNNINYESTLAAEVLSCIRTSQNPFASDAQNSTALTLSGITALLTKHDAATMLVVLVAEEGRLAEFVDKPGGMLAYETSLPYREAQFNCRAAIRALTEITAKSDD